MSKQTNKHGVTKPVQPRTGVKTSARSRPLAQTIDNKAAKHKTAFKKLAKT